MASCCSNKEVIQKTPVKLQFVFLDYIKLLYCWVRSFRNAVAIPSGIYYTGETYDVSTPMLVTSNYLLTVYLIWQVVKKRNVRLLVIDTKGINVWCSSGKGQFSAETILQELESFQPEEKSRGSKLELILPKLSLSGVNLKVLRKNMIKPVIGPIYRYDIPAFIDQKTVTDCKTDTYKFNLRDRLFIMVPSLWQFSKYLLPVAIGLAIWHWFFKTGIHWQFLVLGLGIGLIYIVLFPLLPTRKFAGKALIQSLLTSTGITAYFILTGQHAWLLLASIVTVTIGFNLFFGLYFTGNSGVSNYSLVKKEIITFLPITFLLMLSAAVLYILNGVII